MTKDTPQKAYPLTESILHEWVEESVISPNQADDMWKRLENRADQPWHVDDFSPKFVIPNLVLWCLIGIVVLVVVMGV